SAVRVKTDQFIAFGGREQRGAERVALFIQSRGESRPIACRDSSFQIFHSEIASAIRYHPLRSRSPVMWAVFRDHCFDDLLSGADFSFSSNRRFRSTPQG